MHNSIACVMINVIALSTVDRGFKPQSGQTKDHKIGICYFSVDHAALRKKELRLVGCESG